MTRGRRFVRLAAGSVVTLSMALPAAGPTAALSVVPVPDSFVAVHDRPATVAAPGVLANDLNLLGGSGALLVAQAHQGTVALRSDGGFTYTPDPGFVGTDSFRYRPNALLAGPAVVTITVVNTAPVAVADLYSGTEDRELKVAAPGVLANDLDGDGDPLEAELIGGISNGSIDLDPDGGFVYDPGGSFTGTNTFTYRVWDGVAWSAPTTVTLVIGPASSTPGPSTPPKPTPGATPRPTPSPTPRPTASPTPRPTPSPTPRPTPSPTPPPTPAPTWPPAAAPIGSAQPTATPSPGPSTTPAASASAAATTSPEPSPAIPSGAPATPAGGGPGDLEAPAGRADRFRIPVAGGAGFDPVSPGMVGLAGFEWAVPALALTVPAILLIIALAVQATFGLLWLPLARRRLAGLGIGPAGRHGGPARARRR